MNKEKIIVTAAITGAVHTPSMSEYLPYTPRDIAQDAVRAAKAGAAIVHIHARDPLTGRPDSNIEYFKEICETIKAESDVIICLTTGGASTMTTEERVSVVRELKPEMGSFTTGSINFGTFPMAAKDREWKHDWEKKHLLGSEDRIFTNTFKNTREYAKYFEEANTKPEFEIFDLGMLNSLKYMINAGQVKEPIHIQFILGNMAGLPAVPESLYVALNEARRQFGTDFSWSLSCGGKNQMEMMAAAMAFGGNVRVGLEDSLYIENGKKAKSNAEPVEKVIRIARELGKEPAAPDEVRRLLNLKGLNNVGF